MAAWNASRESKIETVSSLNLSKFYSDTVVFLGGFVCLLKVSLYLVSGLPICRLNGVH